jgi:hypothetical protein
MTQTAHKCYFFSSIFAQDLLAPIAEAFRSNLDLDDDLTEEQQNAELNMPRGKQSQTENLLFNLRRFVSKQCKKRRQKTLHTSS